MNDKDLKSKVFQYFNNREPEEGELEIMFDEENDENGIYFDSLDLIKQFNNKTILNIELI